MGDTVLMPTANGDLKILAADNLTLANLVMSDADVSLLPSIAKPVDQSFIGTGEGKIGGAVLGHAAQLLHQNSAIANGTYNLLDNLLHWALLQTKQSFFEVTSMRLYFIVELMAYNYLPLISEKNLVFENSVSKKDIVFADQESLKIILRNFLDNAIKFSKENGILKIYTQNTNEDYCELIIEDNGIGMSENTRTSLLKETTLMSKKENAEIIGTGLGMQLCKSMIQKNNGKLDIESELGKGTKIIVSLAKKYHNGQY